MKLSGKNSMAVLLLLAGALILLNWFLPFIGWLLGLLMPILILALGYYGLMRGKKVIGIILLAVGAIMLLGKASAYTGLIIAGILIYIGISILSKRKNAW